MKSIFSVYLKFVSEQHTNDTNNCRVIYMEICFIRGGGRGTKIPWLLNLLNRKTPQIIC